MKLFFWRALFVFLVLLLVGSAATYFGLLRPVAQAHTNDPVRLFNHGSIGNEGAQGLPYWIWRVLPQVFPEHLPGNKDGYGAFGVLWRPGEELPVGFAKTTLGVIPRVAPNCAFCHQGSYRLSPIDPPISVTAGAGTRVRVQDYLRFLIAVGNDPRFTADRIMEEVDRLTKLPAWESALYRYLLIPATRQALKAQTARFAWTRSRPDWGPGRIDPFNPVKFHNLELADDGTIGNSDMMPLWALDFRDVDHPTSLHWDGLLTDLHETVVAGAIGDGMTSTSYREVDDDLLRVTGFARVNRPPPSPFSPRLDPSDPFYVALDAVERGKAIYTANCGMCHLPSGARYRTPIPIAEIGTDRHRLDMWTVAARDRYSAYEEGYAWGFKSFEKTDGYVASGHRGLWLRGPYLHNGSVPTLKDLLKPPAERPKTFYRGGDVVDAQNGGFVATGPLAEGGFLYDTALPGNGNQGHLYGTTLDPADKADLLSYLKTL